MHETYHIKRTDNENQFKKYLIRELACCAKQDLNLFVLAKGILYKNPECKVWNAGDKMFQIYCRGIRCFRHNVCFPKYLLSK